jgi:hypothetical protein
VGQIYWANIAKEIRWTILGVVAIIMLVQLEVEAIKAGHNGQALLGVIIAVSSIAGVSIAKALPSKGGKTNGKKETKQA